MGIYVKKQLPISVDPVEVYIKIVDVIYKTEKGSDKWLIQYYSFLSKETSDLLDVYFYFKNVWFVDEANKEKFVPVVLDYTHKLFEDIADKLFPLEEKTVEISLIKPIYNYDSYDELMKDVYQELKKSTDFKFVKNDLESQDDFIKRAVSPYLKDIDKLYDDYKKAMVKAGKNA
jgi:hypothetical protein